MIHPRAALLFGLLIAGTAAGQAIPQRPSQPSPPPGADLREQLQRMRPMPRPGPGAAAKPAQAAAAPHEAAKHAGPCPGHGPDDAPHFSDINWWQGLIGVNNEKAKSDSALNRLLWRYQNPSDHCDSANQRPPVLAQLINLLIVAGVLVKFGRKPLSEALKKRKQSIVGDIENAARLRREAEARLTEYQTKLSALDRTLTQLREEYKAQAVVEREHLLREAQAASARMKKDAEFRVAQDRKATSAALTAEAIEKATSQAEVMLRKHFTAADGERLGAEFIAEVSKASSGIGVAGAAK